jgi:hypothetical protein
MILFLKNFQIPIIIKRVGLWIKRTIFFRSYQSLDNLGFRQQSANMLCIGKMKALGHFSTSCGEATMVKNIFTVCRDNLGTKWPNT